MTLEGVRGDEVLVAALRMFPPPRRILSLEPRDAPWVDLARLFPRAALRDAAIDAEPTWAGWPDLLWFGTALSALRVDAAAAVRSAWRALPDGALVVALAVDATDCATRGLCERLHLDPRRDVGALLRDCFAVLSATDGEPGAAPLRALIGVKAVDRDW